MNITNQDKASILSQALPFLQNYFGKVIVIKYGGNAMTSDELKSAVMQDIVLLSLVGIKVVLVHGGGPEITTVLDKMGIETKFINGLRYTDKETAEVVQMVLSGKTNKDLVSLIKQYKGDAIGLCGIDNQMITAEKLKTSDGTDLGFVGDVKEVNTKPIIDAINNGYIPVIATVACDEQGQVYNINADTAAARIASALGAENIIIMTDTKGILQDKNDENTLIPVVNISDVTTLIKQDVIQSGMIPKVACCVDAVRRGVKKAFIIDGRIQHSILIEMLTNEGIGTMIV